MPIPTVAPEAVAAAKAQLDQHLLEIIEWHFNPATGCQFWLDWARKWKAASARAANDEGSAAGALRDLLRTPPPAPPQLLSTAALNVHEAALLRFLEERLSVSELIFFRAVARRDVERVARDAHRGDAPMGL